MFLIQKVEEVVVSYDDGRKTIGEFILSHPDTIHTYSIDEIARQTHTSKASIVRFAKTLGYEGWKDLKKDLLREKAHAQNADGLDFNYPFHKGDDEATIAQQIARVQQESIRDTMEHLDQPMLAQCTDLILHAGKIVVFGIQPNTSVVQLFQRKMLSIGKSVEISDFREMGMSAKAMNSQDLAMIISYSGNNYSSEPMNTIPYLKENKVPILAITSGGDNYLRMHTPYVLTLCSQERLYTKIANFSTEESLIYLLNVLFACVFARNYDQNNDYKQRSARQIEPGRLKNIHIKE
ncbi:MurR/RpiR family transcriptional regulator [uncultured Dubosiella sp.]|uniref:MurR/RpiR family transcriptional regulator n=1 Tax=uncultured Dubosiella sp. TaxID=1937011 RepID=UPI0026024BE7|nr:MurR/RpiR family transcriptional regulator [uncultured Dubosiella sp.]